MLLSNPSQLSLLADALFIAAIVALIVVNLKSLLLPNKITYTVFIFAIFIRAFIPNLSSFGLLNLYPFSKLPTPLVSIAGALIGAMIAGSSLFLIRWAWQQFRGIEGLGLGDIKMMCMIGAYLGIAKTVIALSLVVVLMLPLTVVIALTFIKRSDLFFPSGFIWGIPAIICTVAGEKILGVLF